jgi:hypothetical protein
MDNSSAVISTLWPYIMTVLGGILSIMVAVLIKKIGNIDTLTEKLNNHLISFEKTLAGLVTDNDCRAAREACVKLNKALIQAPLEKAISEHEEESAERIDGIEKDVEELWFAVRHHIHSKEGVIVEDTPKRYSPPGMRTS